MPMRGWKTADGETLGPVTVAGIPLHDELVAQVEALSHVRTRKLVLPPNLLIFFDAATYRARSNAIVDVFMGILALCLIGLVFDWIILPPSVELPFIVGRIIVLTAYFGAICGLKSLWGCGREGFLVIAPTITMITFAGVCGLMAGPVVLERVMLNTMFATGVCVLLASIRTRDVMILAGLAIGLLVGFMAVSSGHAIAEKTQIVAFYGVGLAALSYARLITNKVQQRLFLLDLSSRIKVREVSRLNAQLYAAARTDPLTGIGNRRFFDDTFEAVRAQAEAGEPLCVCMIDIDHFKRLNDVLGHGRGDDCLQSVAATLRDTLGGEHEIVARCGGEEFVALLPGSSLEQGMAVAERLRLAVYALDLPNPSSPWRRVTISVGVAATPHAPIGDLMRCADEALYQAKQLGRDRVAVYETLVFSDDVAAAA